MSPVRWLIEVHSPSYIAKEIFTKRVVSKAVGKVHRYTWCPFHRTIWKTNYIFFVLFILKYIFKTNNTAGELHSGINGFTENRCETVHALWFTEFRYPHTPKAGNVVVSPLVLRMFMGGGDRNARLSLFQKKNWVRRFPIVEALDSLSLHYLGLMTVALCNKTKFSRIVIEFGKADSNLALVKSAEGRKKIWCQYPYWEKKSISLLKNINLTHLLFTICLLYVYSL